MPFSLFITRSITVTTRVLGMHGEHWSAFRQLPVAGPRGSCSHRGIRQSLRTIPLIVRHPPRKSRVISSNKFKIYIPSLAVQYHQFKDFQNKNVREALIVKIGFLAKLLKMFPKCSED